MITENKTYYFQKDKNNDSKDNNFCNYNSFENKGHQNVTLNTLFE